MKRRRPGSIENERGSVAVLVAVMLTAIVGLAALGTDVGRLYAERTRLASIADAAALSGAQHLPDSEDLALLTAAAYLSKNNVDVRRVTMNVSDDKRHLDVRVNKTVPLTFARIVGFSQSDVAGDAGAWTGNLSGYYGAAPLGVPKADWVVGQQVYLKLGADSGTISPGNYQALALGKSGASMYEQNLKSGYKNWLRIDTWVDTETGNMAGPTVRAINYRISQDPYVTYANTTRQSPRLVVVPVLEDFNVNGKGQVHVVGFAVFFLENATDEGGGKATVVGRFVKMVVEGETSQTAPDYGARVTKLTK